MRTVAVFVAAVTLVSCGVAPPRGQEDQTTFVQESQVEYQEAYRIIGKQMRGCYTFRVIVDETGYDLKAHIDTAARVGRIELYPTSFARFEKAEHAMPNRTVVVRANGTGSTIETSGTSPRIVYQTHVTIPRWLEGDQSCKYQPPPLP